MTRGWRCGSRVASSHAALTPPGPARRSRRPRAEPGTRAEGLGVAAQPGLWPGWVQERCVRSRLRGAGGARAGSARVSRLGEPGVRLFAPADRSAPDCSVSQRLSPISPTPWIWVCVISESGAGDAKGRKRGNLGHMHFGPTSWCLSWDLALVREALLQGPVFCITFLPPARPWCNPPSQGPLESGDGPCYFLWRWYRSFGLSAFLSYEISIWCPWLPHPQTDALKCPVWASERGEGREGLYTVQMPPGASLLAHLLLPSSVWEKCWGAAPCPLPWVALVPRDQALVVATALLWGPRSGFPEAIGPFHPCCRHGDYRLCF